MSDLLNSYVATALWSSIDDNDEPMDNNYSIGDIDTNTLKMMESDCNEFIDKAGELLNGIDYKTAMHDFWLTRNGYGAGFWDGDYPEPIGKKLTELSKEFGECDLYVGGNGKLYI